MALAGTVDVAASSFVCSDVVIRGTVAIGENVLIHPGVVLDASDGGRIHIQEGCIIDDCVFISAGADGVCSVGPNTRIRSMASLRNVKLGKGCEIGERGEQLVLSGWKRRHTSDSLVSARHSGKRAQRYRAGSRYCRTVAFERPCRSSKSGRRGNHRTLSSVIYFESNCILLYCSACFSGQKKKNTPTVRLEEVSCDDFCVLPAGAYVDEGDALPARTVVIGATNERRTQDAEAIEAAEVALEQLRRTTKKIFDAEQRRWAAPE